MVEHLCVSEPTNLATAKMSSNFWQLYWSKGGLFNIRGKKWAAFGDSITANSVGWHLTARTNLGLASIQDIYNATGVNSFAKGGDSYESAWERMHHLKLMTDTDSRYIPDLITFTYGTNESTLDFGDFDTCIGMTYAQLDSWMQTKFYPAPDYGRILGSSVQGYYTMRWAIETAKRWYPNAQIMAWHPIQRNNSDYYTANYFSLIEKQKAMFNWLSVPIIDAWNESGITKDFEVNKDAGRYLIDGTHPAPAGYIILGNFMTREILKNWINS